MRAEPDYIFFVDCEPCVNSSHGGAAAACADNKPLARVHRFMHDIMDDVPFEAVIWMPSHVKKGHCGQIVRGDGFLLTETNVAFNDAADRLAKAAVEAHRGPHRIRMAIEAHDALTTENAMWIARATVIANQQPGDPVRNTQASRAKAVEAAAAKRRTKAAAAAAAATQPAGATTAAASTAGAAAARTTVARDPPPWRPHPCGHGRWLVVHGMLNEVPLMGQAGPPGLQGQ